MAGDQSLSHQLLPADLLPSCQVGLKTLLSGKGKLHVLGSPEQGFSALVLLTSWAQCFVVRGCPMNCRAPPTRCRWCPLPPTPDFAKSPLIENHWTGGLRIYHPALPRATLHKAARMKTHEGQAQTAHTPRLGISCILFEGWKLQGPAVLDRMNPGEDLPVAVAPHLSQDHCLSFLDSR